MHWYRRGATCAQYRVSLLSPATLELRGNLDKKRGGSLFGSMRVQRKPLAVLTVESLRAGIENGTWGAKLPSENSLSAELGVSRTTLRVALKILKREGVLARKSTPARVFPSTRVSHRRGATNTVNILLSLPFEELPNFVIFWMNELRAQLHSTGCALNLKVSRAFFREKNGGVRERLVAQHPARCWILVFSKPDLQRWFQEHNIPTVIAGLPGPGISLPNVAVDSHAVMYHMLGGLTARGHRRIALLTGNASSTMPGGFLRPFEETCQRIGIEKIEPAVLYVSDDSPEHVGREIVNAVRRKDGPTALVIFNPLHAVTAFSYLPVHGVVIPRDLSIVTTFGDGYLEHLSPAPSRYEYNARRFARKLHETIQKMEMGINPADLHTRLTLEPIEGKSVGAPRRGPVLFPPAR